MSAAVQELRFALRGLIKSPVLSGVAILTLGLGIGMTALMFSLVYGALFRGLPFPEEGRIIRVGWIQPSAPDAWRALSVYDYAQLKASQKPLVDLAGVYTGTVNLAGIGRQIRRQASKDEEPWRTIVGVVPDLYMEGLMRWVRYDPSGIYIPVAQTDARFLSITVRGPASPATLAAIVRDEVATLHADTPIYLVRSMARALREEIWFSERAQGTVAVVAPWRR